MLGANNAQRTYYHIVSLSGLHIERYARSYQRSHAANWREIVMCVRVYVHTLRASQHNVF